MTYALPILLNLMRFAWLWPWMILLQSFMSPSFPGAVVTPWLLVAVPLLSFLTATWVANRTVPVAQPTPGMPEDTQLYNQTTLDRAALDLDESIGWTDRLLVAGIGILVTVGVAWWHHYQSLYALLNPRWLYELGYTLTHWGTQEVPPEVLTVFFLIFLWINGMGDAVRAMTHDDVWGALVRSVGALIFFVALMTVTSQPLPTYVFYLIILLFGSGMVALAFSSLKITVGLDRALGLGQRRIAATPTISRYWLGSVLMTVFGLLAIGILIALVLAPEQLAVLINAAATVLRWIGGILGQVLLFASYAIFMVFYFFAKLLEPLFERLMNRMADSPLTEMLGEMEAVEEMEQVAEGTAVLPDSYRWMGLAVVIFLVIIAFALAVRRLRSTPAEVEDETRESILTTDLLQEQLSGLWNRWFHRRRAPGDPFLSLEDESLARRRIREIYQQLLANAAAVGAARTPAETPDEYQQHLHHSLKKTTPEKPPRQEASAEETVPGETLSGETLQEEILPEETLQEESDALATITAAYHQARYAPEAPDDAQSNAVQAAWQLLENRLLPKNKEGDSQESTDDPKEKE